MFSIHEYNNLDLGILTNVHMFSIHECNKLDLGILTNVLHRQAASISPQTISTTITNLNHSKIMMNIQNGNINATINSQFIVGQDDEALCDLSISNKMKRQQKVVAVHALCQKLGLSSAPQETKNIGRLYIQQLIRVTLFINMKDVREEKL
ncbi:hypothetical protein KSP39_PZI016550 [Platanthera zijinensis]|uniref:Uncharacterized protein n=1 Tax=Platanthera zijinensis TaxID=2320716 RepID=A0AAP0B6N3_9ASPA